MQTRTQERSGIRHAAIALALAGLTAEASAGCAPSIAPPEASP